MKKHRPGMANRNTDVTRKCCAPIKEKEMVADIDQDRLDQAEEEEWMEREAVQEAPVDSPRQAVDVRGGVPRHIGR